MTEIKNHKHTLSDIQVAMIIDSSNQRNKQSDDAHTTNPDSEHQKTNYEDTMHGGLPPQSRMTYRTGDSFIVSNTSRSGSRSRSQSQSRSRSGPRFVNVLKRSPFVPPRDGLNNASIDSKQLIHMI